MTNKLTAKIVALRRAQQRGRFAEFVRAPRDFGTVAGYLLEHCADCFLLEEFNWDCFKWNGKCIIMSRDVKEIRIFKQSDWPILAGEAQQMLRAVSPARRTETLPRFLARSINSGDVIEVEQERRCPADLFLCKVRQFGERGLLVTSYDTSLRGTELEISYKDLTKVSFRDGYSNAVKFALR